MNRTICQYIVSAGDADCIVVRNCRAQVALDDEFGKSPSWKSPTAAEVRSQVVAWLDERKPEDAVGRQVLTLWPESEATADASKQPSSAQLLERVVTTLSMVDPQAKQVADLCTKPHDAFKTPQFTWLADSKTPAFVRNNLRLLLGRWLVQQQMYDEGLAQLADLQTADVVDPGVAIVLSKRVSALDVAQDRGAKEHRPTAGAKENDSAALCANGRADAG